MTTATKTNPIAYLVRGDEHPQWGLVIDEGDTDWARCQPLTDDEAQALLEGATEVHDIDRFGDVEQAWQLPQAPVTYGN